MLGLGLFADGVQLSVFIGVARSLREGVGESFGVVWVSVRVVERLTVLDFRLEMGVVDDVGLDGRGGDASEG